MSNYLVIIESPGKINNFKKYLGPDYECIASYGHIADLPKKGNIGVDVKKDFKTTFNILDDKKDIVNSIIAKSKKAKMTYLMTDLDREGESISWMISQHLPKDVKFCRATTSSITKEAILEAIKNPRNINQRMVDSFLTRRILDRLVGWKTSFLVKQSTGGISAGRVQSAALRILSEREKEIIKFVPVEYWPIEVELLTNKKEIIKAKVAVPDEMDIKNEKNAKDIEQIIKNNKITVTSYQTKQTNINPAPPFTTSKLQSSASSLLGWSQDKTMKIAQDLYEAGHCTYIRTDSTNIEAGPMKDLQNEISNRYGANYLSLNKFKVSKNAQEAHEAIRPTKMDVETVGNGDMQKLYSLIWKRTISSQMKPEIRDQVSATFKAKDIIMKSSGSRQSFDGWKKCWDYKDATDTYLPELKEKEEMSLKEITFEQKFTTPPPRYGVATFNSKLEELGIARPSTLATVTKTLQAREYIETKGNTHHVTDLGLRVTDFLIESNFCFVDTDFTKEMEDKLDDILNSKLEKNDVLNNFWTRLSNDLEKAKNKKSEINKTEYKCPTCSKKGIESYLLKKFSKFGPFFACESRTTDVKCDFTAIVGEDNKPVEKVKKEIKESNFKCDNCKEKLIIRQGPYGEFLGCRNWNKEAECKGIYQLDGTKVVKASKPKWKKWKKK